MFLTQERYRAGLGSRKKLRIRIGFRRIRNICTARAANSRPYIHNRHLPDKYKFDIISGLEIFSEIFKITY